MNSLLDCGELVPQAAASEALEEASGVHQEAELALVQANTRVYELEDMLLRLQSTSPMPTVCLSVCLSARHEQLLSKY